MLRRNFFWEKTLMSQRLNRKIVMVLAMMAMIAAVSIRAADNTGVLQGVVKDNAGAPVAGAFVKMKNAERRLTFMVISQPQGRYTANVPPGSYVVQGVGGEYQSALSTQKDVSSGRSTTVDVALTDKRTPHLPNAWPGRPPGQGGGEAAATAPLKLPDGNGKQLVTGKCSMCHDAARIANARYDRAHWLDIIDDMQAYARGSEIARELTNEEVNVLLDYLLANFSDAERGRRARQPVDPNSRLPRTLMQGDATKYIAVEFELPKTNVEPHELTVDNRGNGWLTQRTGGRLGRFDTKTFTYTELEPPAGATQKVRLNGIVRGPDNKLWFVDGGPNRRWLNYDLASETFNVFPVPKLKYGNSTGNTMRVHPNGTVWLCNIGSNQIIRLDPKTNKFDVWEVPAGVQAKKNATPYGMAVAGDGKVWFVENTFNQLGRFDPATRAFTEFALSNAEEDHRRIEIDPTNSNRIWWTGNVSGRIGYIELLK